MRRLKTIADIRRFLAHVINEVHDGKMEPSIAGRLGYLANILRTCVIDGDLEERIKALELKADDKTTKS